MFMRMLTALLTALCAPFLFAADLKVTEKHSGPTDPNWTTTRWYSGSRWRRESRFERQLGLADRLMRTSQPHMAAIYQCDASRILELNLDSREYVTQRLDGNGFPFGVKPRRATAQRSGGTVTITIESRDTGERKKIFDYLARRLMTTVKEEPSPGACWQPHETVTDTWYADLDVPTRGCAGMTKPTEGHVLSRLVAGNCEDAIVVRRNGIADTGLPLESTTTSHSRFVDRGVIQDSTYTSFSRVTELSQAPLDPALFEAPAGFKKVDHFAQQPEPLAARLVAGWEHFVQSVGSIFK